MADEPSPRNETLPATRHPGRVLWKRWAACQVRSRAEARMACLEAFGARIMSQDPDRRILKIQIIV